MAIITVRGMSPNPRGRYWLAGAWLKGKYTPIFNLRLVAVRHQSYHYQEIKMNVRGSRTLWRSLRSLAAGLQPLRYGRIKVEIKAAKGQLVSMTIETTIN